jgi:hypothetical protein
MSISYQIHISFNASVRRRTNKDIMHACMTYSQETRKQAAVQRSGAPVGLRH